MCGGVAVHVTERESFEPYLTGIAAISAARAMYPDFFKWRDPPYEYEYEKRPIEILCGNRRIPELMERGADWKEIRQSWQGDVEAFLRRRSAYLLYE